MTRFVGLDVHKRFVEFCILDSEGKRLLRGSVECNRDSLTAFAEQSLRKKDSVALEATTNTWPVVKLLQPFVARVVVGNPMKTRAIAEAKVKTDKVDAEILANLLRCDYLPEVWQPDEQTQMLRSLITHRTSLMTQRARHKNHIQSLLGGLLIHSPCKVLWTKTGLTWLRRLKLPSAEKFILDSELRQLDETEREIALLDEQLTEIAQREPRVRLLMTLPGVGHVVAIGLLAALGDIDRFRDGAHAASYLGLVPSTRQSGDHCYHGHITKAGNPQVRGLLTQSCQHAARHPGPLGAFFRRLAKRKNRQVAMMALARKMVIVAYLMLKNNEPYRYAKPETVAAKFSKLDRAKTKHSSAMQRRKANSRIRRRNGLAATYADVGLPAVLPLEKVGPGERRMLSDAELDGFVQGIYSTVPAPTSEKSNNRPKNTKEQAKKSGRPKGRPN